jgi:hypothetical protein
MKVRQLIRILRQQIAACRFFLVSFMITGLIFFSQALYGAINASAGIIFPELDSGAGARAAAMGGAFTAVADDASAAYWNPAGLSQLKKTQIMITFDKWFMDSFYQHIITSLPLGTGTAAADIFYMNYGTFETVGNTGLLLGGTINPYDAAGTFSYGLNIGNQISLGAGLTYAMQSVGSAAMNGFGINIGALYKADLFSAGFSAKNIGTGGGFSMPADIRLGAAFDVIKNRSNTALIAMDAAYIVNDAPQLSLGAEYSIMKIFSLRAGYTLKFKDQGTGILNGFSAGLGFSAGDLYFDYAVLPFGELGLVQKAGMNFEFDFAKSGGTGEKTVQKQPVTAKPENIHDMLTRAGTMENAGKLEAAKEKYLEIIDLDVNNGDAWKRLGAVYVKLGRKIDAINAFERYLLINPDDGSVLRWVKKNSN